MAYDVTGFIGSYSGMLSNIILVIELLVFAGIILAVVFYLTNLKKYDTQVEIRSIRTDGYGNRQWKVLTDKGAYMKDKKTGAPVFRLFRARRNYEPPPYEYLEPATLGMFVKNKAYAVQTSDDRLHWIKPNYLEWENCKECGGSGVSAIDGTKCETCNGNKQVPKEIKYKIADKDVEFWASTQMESDLQAFGKPKWWEPLVLPIAGVIIFFMAIIVIWLLLDKIGAIGSVCNSALQSCGNMAKSCAGVSQSATPAPNPPGW